MKLKYTVTPFLFFCICSLTHSQNRIWKMNVKASLGAVLSNKHWNGYVTRKNDNNSYRGEITVSYPINKAVSLSTGMDLINVDKGEDSGERIKFNNETNDNFLFLHIPIIMNLHTNKSKKNGNYWNFGVGPSLNFTLNSGEYKFYSGYWTDFEESGTYYDARKMALNGKKKIKPFNIGIQLSVMYHFRRFGAGLEGNVGLLNMNRQYSVRTEKRYICHIWPTISYQF